MKDGRTHLAHKAEHAVDMETGAIVAVTLQGADVGDTTTIIETAIAAAEQVEDAQANVDDRQSLEEIVGDKGYHSNQTLIDLDAGGIRSYVSERARWRVQGHQQGWLFRQAARGRRSGEKRRAGTPLEHDRAPWVALGVSRRTWYRHFRGAKVGTEPIQIDRAPGTCSLKASVGEGHRPALLGPHNLPRRHG